MNLELNSYGICLDSGWCYIALDWKLITVSVVGAILYKVIKKRKAN